MKGNLFELRQIGLSAYSMAGDIAVIPICAVVFILLGSSYVIKNKSYRIFSLIVVLVFLAAIVNILFNELMSKTDFVANNPFSQGVLYLLRVLYHALLFDVLFAYTLYAVVISNMEHKSARIIAITSMMLFFAIVAIDVVLTFTGNGFEINKATGQAEGGSNVFMIGYILYVVFLSWLMFRIRKLVYKRVLIGFYAIILLAFAVRISQIILGQSSLTKMSFVFSILVMLYYVHINPYDMHVDTLDSSTLEDMVKNLNAKNKPFVYMSLLLPEFVPEGL